MKRDDILLTRIYSELNKPQEVVNEGIMDWITGKSRIQRDNNLILAKLKEFEDAVKKSGMNPESFVDYNKINYAIKGENKPSEPEVTPEVTSETPAPEPQPEPTAVSQPAVEKEVTSNQPVRSTPTPAVSRPKEKKPESNYYYVPNEFLEDNPAKVGQNYISLPNLIEYLGITPKEYQDLSKQGYLGVKKIDGVPYVRVDMVEGKNYFRIMTYLNDKDMEAKKAQQTEAPKKSTPKKTIKKKPTTKKTIKKKK